MGVAISALEPDRTEAAMKEFSRGVGEGFAGCGEWGHPLEIEAAAAGQYSDLAARTATVLGLPELPPVLARWSRQVRWMRRCMMPTGDCII